MPAVGSYRTLINNATAVFAGRIAAIAFGVALATMLFRTLGAERYGQWSLLTLLAGYSTLVDFGLSSAVERRVASLAAHDTHASIPATINTSLTALVAGAAIAEVLVLAVLSVVSPAAADTWRAIAILPICSGVTLAALAVGAVLAGQQRMVLLQSWRTSGLAVGTAAVGGAVALGQDALDTLLVLYTIGSVLTFGLAWATLRRTLPDLRLRPEWDRDAARDLFWFGGVVQFATMVPPLAEYAFRLIIGARFGLAYSGVYDLGARAAMVPRSLAGSLFSAMIPFAVQTERAGGAAALRGLVRTTARHVALIILPASALLVAFAGPLVTVWLGEAPLSDQVRDVLVLLLVAHAAGAVAVPAAMVGRALGRPAPEAIGTTVAFLAAVVLARFVPSFELATFILWGLPAIAGFACWLWLDRTAGIGFVNGLDAVLAVAVAAAAFVIGLLLMPTGHAPVRVLLHLAGAGLAALAAAGLVETGYRRRWRTTVVPAGPEYPQ
ncbi:MAG: oligosaccharide flippase family protein [Vicinamibacterales bacterium]